jgi:hypothetical protein
LKSRREERLTQVDKMKERIRTMDKTKVKKKVYKRIEQYGIG